MGNVGASSKPIQDPKFDLPAESQIESKQKKPLENPGTMEELHKKCKDLMPVFFEGAKLMIQQNKLTAAQLTTDYKGSDFTSSLTVGNPNLINSSGVLVGHYLQAVTNKLSLGSEIAYQYGPQVPGGEIAIVSAAGRYGDENSVWSGTIGSSGVHLCYYQKASEQLQVGVELETSFRMQEATATIGYQVDLPKADLVFRGMADTNWNVAAVLEKKLQPLPFSFALSGLLNHQKNSFRLGCGLIIG
ncbi:CLUMA_CG009341, isoform A [Clunio marinus]|uniref:CLUMA_CG009341, isoform A n=1 Tax=Clunio marinus TaxID=568069 RepID=A0A1J1I6F0_9DIPT|nr:CLUMA_CG009341, isoform A [Clunio marinus]